MSAKVSSTRGLLLPLNYRNTKNSLLLFFLFLFSNLSAQQIEVRIFGDQNDALEGVNATSKNYDLSLFSDQNGIIRFSQEQLLKSDTVYFIFPGYSSAVLRNSDISSGLKIELQSLLIDLGEITILGRFDQTSDHIDQEVDIISSEEIAFLQSQTSADVLADKANVFVQKSQMGGGSPILRGFEASRVLLVVDGVRMNNAIYRSGHLQNAITLDNQVMRQIEVIHGPGSLIYGSDAIGGVIHYRTKEPSLIIRDTDKRWSGQLQSRYATANRGRTFHGELNYAHKKWASLTSVSVNLFDDLRSGKNGWTEYEDFGDREFYVMNETTRTFGVDSIQTPGDPSIQMGSGYNQYDILQKFKFQPNQYWKHILTINGSTSSNIPRYDRLTEKKQGLPKFSEWYYGPQNRLTTSWKTKYSKSSRLFDDVNIIAAYQFIEEDRINRKFNELVQNTSNVDVHAYSITTDFVKNIGKSSLFYGVDLNCNRVISEAMARSKKSTSIIPIYPRYPDGYNIWTTSGVYMKYDGTLKPEKLNFSVGGRMTYTQTGIEYENNELEFPEELYGKFSSNNISFTGSAALKYYPTKNLSIRAVVANAFRSPNIDDIAKIRIKSGTTTVPNLSLRPEKSINGEVGIQLSWDNIKSNMPASFINLVGFYTILEDVIVQRPFSFLNQSELFIEGEPYMTLANINALEGHVYGVSSKIQWQLAPSWKILGSIAYTKGRSYDEKNIEEPLAHIPPVYGQLALVFQNKTFQQRISYRFNGEKRLEDYAPDSSENLDKATPNGTPAWAILNYHVAYFINDKITLYAGVENILDQRYRPYSSGINGPGRNITGSIKWTF